MSQGNREARSSIEPSVDPKGRLAVESLLEHAVCEAADYRRSTESTNSLALAEFSRKEEHPGSPCPKIFVADQQTRGRGRQGRRWVSSDSTLTFSLMIDRGPVSQSLIHFVPLSVGVGIARYLEFEFAPLRVRLKWPNDVHLAGGKVAGILIETSSLRPDRMVIGVGVNVGEAPKLDSLPETQSARGLTEVLGRELNRYDLLYGLVTHLLKAMEDGRRRPRTIVDEFRQRCLLSGQVVCFQQGESHREGLCRGISEHGALMVEDETGIRHLHSGETNLVRART